MIEDSWLSEQGFSVVPFRTARRSPELLAELSLAHLANLKGDASSDQSQNLSSLLNFEFPRLAGQGLPARAAYRPQKLASKRSRAIAAFLGQLLLGWLSRDGGGWIRLSLDKKSFTAQPVSYRAFDGLRQCWKAAGLLEEHTGYPRSLGFGRPGPAVGSMSRFRATTKLLEFCKAQSITPEDAHEHFHIVFEMPSELVRLTSPSLQTPKSNEAQELRDEVAALNSFFAQHKLEGARHVGWVRMFHDADAEDIRFNKGGRLYSQPNIKGLNYQQMNRDRRIAMTIDGQPLAEIDISASYMTIFHAAHGQTINLAGAYDDILGSEAIHRAIVKFWVNASFGNSSLIGAWSARLKQSFAAKHRKEGWELDAQAYPVRHVREATLARHPLLASIGEAVNGIGTGFGDLMIRESQAIITTMKELALNHVPSAPVHDSLIVPRSEVTVARRSLEEQFKAVVGVIPILKVYPLSAQQT